MKRIALIFLSLCVYTLTVQCKEDKKQKKDDTPVNKVVEVSIEMTHKGETVQLNDTAHFSGGNDLYISLFRMYLSNITGISADGKEFRFTPVVLVDPGNPAANSFQMTIPAIDYKNLRMGFGVDAEQNDSDPASFENEHPLSTYQTMYWPMMKYRFVKFEGKSMAASGGGDIHAISIHPGTDALYQLKTFDFNETLVPEGEYQLVIEMDLEKIFNGPAGVIDLSDDVQVHSTASDIDIAETFMKNMAAATNIEFVSIVP